MRGDIRRLLPVLLILGFVFCFASGCLGQTEAPPEDDFGQKAEALNARIAAASSASSAQALGTELAALRAIAQNESRYSGYLPLLESQNLTLQVLAIYFEFQSEGAVIGTSGLDCGRNYSSFISRLRTVNSTAASAKSKAQSYLGSNSNSSASLLITALNKTNPDTMSFYAELMEADLLRDCPAQKTAPENLSLPLSYDDSLSIAQSEAGNKFYVYGFSEPLDAGTVVTAPRAFEDHNYTLSNETWFFFLDSEPWGPFAHDALYVMIDASTGAYYVANESMYPLIDGVPRWKTMDERSDPANILYPTDAVDIFSFPANLSVTYSRYVHPFPLAGPDFTSLNEGREAGKVECCLEKRKFALILTGSNDTQFQANTKMMHEFLKSSGYGDDEIQYLAAAANVSGSDGMATVANLAGGLNWLKRNAKCCDEIFIYLAAHGSKDPVFEVRHRATNQTKWIRSAASLGASPGDWERTGNTGDYHSIDVNRGREGGGSASSQILYTYLRDMESCRISILYQSCHSGAAAPTFASLPGVSVMTPVDSEHSSYGISADSGGWKAGSFFTQAYINAKTKDNATADANHDGQVSDKEAFDRADQVNRDTIEGIRDHWRGKAENETDPFRKGMYQAKAYSMQEQNGVYKEGGPCRCCFVNCSQATQYSCKVFEGKNKRDSPDCKKVGDYCGPTVTPPPMNETPPTGNATAGNQTGGAGGNQTGNMTNGTGTSGGEPPLNGTAVCGDGNITGAEQCDHGSAGTNKCSEGNYCSKCQCKKLETSVVCGDGKISKPNEDCDGGSVDYKLCPTGQTCKLCKCVQTQAACGDGTVTPPEECDHGNSYTNYCPSGKICSGCKCYVPGDEPPSEAYCGNNKREGSEQCDGTDDSACSADEACKSCACVSSADCGDGDVEAPEECESDSDCDSGEHCSGCRCVSTPLYCGDKKINGDEQCDGSSSGCDESGVCGSNCQCVYPPTLNCEYICSQTSGAESLGGSYSTSSECGAAAKSLYGTRMCYLTCTYAYLYKVTNIAGSATCCCAMKKEFACSNCPGENPVCPNSETTCAANAPSWYSP